jgi:hypothetical protein
MAGLLHPTQKHVCPPPSFAEGTGKVVGFDDCRFDSEYRHNFPRAVHIKYTGISSDRC